MAIMALHDENTSLLPLKRPSFKPSFVFSPKIQKINFNSTPSCVDQNTIELVQSELSTSAGADPIDSEVEGGDNEFSEEDDEDEDEEEPPIVFANNIPESLDTIRFQDITRMNESDFELIRHLVIPAKPEVEEKKHSAVPLVKFKNGNLVVDNMVQKQEETVDQVATLSNNIPRSDADTNLFYIGIRIFGGNIDNIARLFPNRTRRAVGLWYSQERKKNSAILQQTTNNLLDIELDDFLQDIESIS